MSGKDKRGEIKIGGAADAHQGLFYRWFTFALSVYAEVWNTYGPRPLLSERRRKRGKDGQMQSVRNADAATVAPLITQCQRLNKELPQNLPLSGSLPHDRDFEQRGVQVRPAGLPANWVGGWPDGHAAVTQSVIWVRKVYAFCLMVGETKYAMARMTEDDRVQDDGRAPGGGPQTPRAGYNVGSKKPKRWPPWSIRSGRVRTVGGGLAGFSGDGARRAAFVPTRPPDGARCSWSRASSCGGGTRRHATWV
jgi:hypothetical protein